MPLVIVSYGLVSTTGLAHGVTARCVTPWYCPTWLADGARLESRSRSPYSAKGAALRGSNGVVELPKYAEPCTVTTWSMRLTPSKLAYAYGSGAPSTSVKSAASVATAPRHWPCAD